MKRVLKIVIITYAITYLLLILLWMLGDRDPNNCTAGQEIEEGCKIAFPATFIILAFVNIPIAAVTSLAVGIFTLLRNKFRK